MNNNGPVMVVEDDMDDRELLAMIFKELAVENEILFFTNGRDAFDYLTTSGVIPFLILSDIQMPGLTGPELCLKIRTDERLRDLYIPFVYFTTSTTRTAISHAYTVFANGFFIKPSSFTELTALIETILSYWKNCQIQADYE
jgi:CheY-like chemotaxis protein